MLPEGRYFIEPVGGESAEIYIEASSYNAVEVMTDGVDVTSKEVVARPVTGQGDAVKILRMLQSDG